MSTSCDPLGSKADIERVATNVRFGPEADVRQGRLVRRPWVDS